MVVGPADGATAVAAAAGDATAVAASAADATAVAAAAGVRPDAIDPLAVAALAVAAMGPEAGRMPTRITTAILLSLTLRKMAWSSSLLSSASSSSLGQGEHKSLGWVVASFERASAGLLSLPRRAVEDGRPEGRVKVPGLQQELVRQEELGGTAAILQDKLDTGVWTRAEGTLMLR